MNRSVSTKLAVLLPIMFVTWSLTSKLVARQAREESAQQLTLTKTLDDPSKPRALTKGKWKASKASGRITSRSFQVNGNEVRIDASFDMESQIKGVAHIWRLRAYTEGDKQVEMDKFYTEQIFEMHPSGKMKPTFSETIQLPPGQHRVVLSLYGVAKGSDLSELNDEEKAKAARLFQVPRVVVIQ